MVPAFALALVLAIGLPGCVHREQPRARPTIVLVSIDTLRADRVGAYGATSAETPALDDLAREGLIFEAASTPVPLTLPAHASLFTGLYPPRHGVRANGIHRLATEPALLAEKLREAGYRTGAFIGGYPLVARFGLDRGFDHYDDDLSTEAGGFQYPERPGGVVVEQALRWTAAQPRPQPLFLFVHLYDPHADYAPPEPFATRFAGRPYDGEVAYADSVIGRLRDALKEQGRWDDALVAVVGDHGEGLGDHDEDTHGLLLFETTLRVPFILRAPGLAAGRAAEPVSLVDVAPTLIALAGAPGLGTIDGVDVSGRRDPQRDLYAETLAPYLDHGWAGLRALRRGSLKLIDGPRPRLFDLAADSSESHTLWPSAEGASLRTALDAATARLGQRPPETVALDAAAREALRSLGYFASAAEVPADFGTGRPDPHDRVELARELDAAAAEGLRDPKGAARRLAALARRDPGNNLAWRRLAAVRMRARDFDGAVRAYQEAARAGYRGDDLAEALGEAHLRAGEALAEARDLAAARRHLTEAARLQPGRGEVRHALGVLEARAGRLAAAVEAFRKAAALAPGYAPAWFSLGLAHERQGRTEEARDAYRRFLSLGPSATPERDHAAAFLAAGP